MQDTNTPRIFLMILLVFLGILCGGAVASELSNHSTPLAMLGAIAGAILAGCVGLFFARAATPARR
jgi:hypothetical protein